MFVITDQEALTNYRRLSDRYNEAKNFRLYYKEKPTNLIWYDGKILYIPNEYFELRNLVNVDMQQKLKCSLFPSDIKLIKELKQHQINFLLEDNLEELFRRIESCGMIFDNDSLAVELVDNNDYTKIQEPIYLGSGVWLNLNKE
jgi:hypothetical protein